MSGSVSLAPTNVRHDADRLHPLRRTESDRDLAYLIRTFLRFSAQQECAQLADFVGGSQSREARICSVPLRQFQRRVAVVGSVAHLVAKDPGDLLAMSRGGDRGKVHTRTGRKPYPRCLAGGSSDRTVQLWGWPPPVRSAPRRQVTPTQTTQICFQAPRPPCQSDC
jgi:hypothetical protein